MGLIKDFTCLAPLMTGCLTKFQRSLVQLANVPLSSYHRSCPCRPEAVQDLRCFSGGYDEGMLSYGEMGGAIGLGGGAKTSLESIRSIAAGLGMRGVTVIRSLLRLPTGWILCSMRFKNR